MTYFHRLFDWPSFIVVGPDAAPWLNGLVTCDLSGSSLSRASDIDVPGAGAPRQSVMGLLLNKQGKAQAQLQFAGTQDRVIVGVAGGDREDVIRTLDDHLVMEDAEIERGDDLRWAILLGPDAVEQGRSRGLDAHSSGWGPALVDCALVLFSGAEGARQLDELRQSTIEMSASRWEAERIQRGIPEYGRDFGPRDNPHEAGLDRRAVCWQKGCYLGQEVVCMQDMRGKVKRRLVRLSSSEPVDWSAAQELKNGEGQPVGQVTSGQGQAALAMVKAPDYEPGTVLSAGNRQVVVEPLSPS